MRTLKLKIHSVVRMVYSLHMIKKETLLLNIPWCIIWSRNVFCSFSLCKKKDISCFLRPNSFKMTRLILITTSVPRIRRQRNKNKTHAKLIHFYGRLLFITHVFVTQILNRETKWLFRTWYFFWSYLSFHVWLLNTS